MFYVTLLGQFLVGLQRSGDIFIWHKDTDLVKHITGLPNFRQFSPDQMLPDQQQTAQGRTWGNHHDNHSVCNPAGFTCYQEKFEKLELYTLLSRSGKRLEFAQKREKTWHFEGKTWKCWDLMVQIYWQKKIFHSVYQLVLQNSDGAPLLTWRITI